MTVLTDKYQTAKKSHICDLCFEKIKAGEKYHYQTGVYDGFYQFKSHDKCELIAGKLKMYDDDEGLNGDSFSEFIWEEFKDIQRKINSGNFNKRDFIYPNFRMMVAFVQMYHGIK